MLRRAPLDSTAPQAHEFDEHLVEKVPPANLPTGWRDEPPPPATKRLGDTWVKQARPAVLELPSVIIPGESNFLLNTAHPGFNPDSEVLFADSGKETTEAQRTPEGTEDSDKETGNTKWCATQGPL